MNTKDTVTGQLQRDPTPYEMETLKREQRSAATESAAKMSVDDDSEVGVCDTSQ